jgi:DNA ligase-1
MAKVEFRTLYKNTSLGQLQSWQIVVDGNTYYTIEGIHELTTSKPTVCVGKNIGRANETSAEEQAFLEAKSLFKKKIDKGYSEDAPQASKFFEPMLAHEREKYEKLLFTVPTYVQPKLDGVRCILKDGRLTSRNGKQIVSCPHLEFPNWFLDGELYSHELKEDFNKIISLTRKSKPTQEDLDESAKVVEYWIYDQPHEDVFSVRFSNIFIPKSLSHFKLVPTFQVFSLEEIENYHEQFLSEGYEGTMIRLDLGPYENKRSKQLLKYKNFKDAEFLILDVEEGLGNRSGMAGKLICLLPNGNKVGVSMTGTQEFMTQVLKDKDKIIGKEATIKYFNETPDGSLRFPTLKHIIGYEMQIHSI